MNLKNVSFTRDVDLPITRISGNRLFSFNLIFDQKHDHAFSLIHSLSRECTYTISSLPLPQNSFFCTSVYLSSFLLSVFLSRSGTQRKNALLCKTIFNPFSPLFFKSFAPHPAPLSFFLSLSRPHSFYFDFTASPVFHFISLFFSLAAFVSSSLDDLL